MPKDLPYRLFSTATFLVHISQPNTLLLCVIHLSSIIECLDDNTDAEKLAKTNREFFMHEEISPDIRPIAEIKLSK